MYKVNYIQIKQQSSRTEEMHDYVAKSMVEFLGDKPIANLTIDDVRKWRQYLLRTRCENTVRGYILKLRRVLEYCKVCKIDTLDADLIPVPKRIEKVPDFLTEDEVGRMIEASTTVRSKFVISLLYSSGARLSEALSLSRGQIYQRKFTVVGKGNKVRLCFIDDRTERYMNEYLKRRHDNSNALLVSRLNQDRMTKTNIEFLVKNAAAKAGIDKRVTPHTLRHSFATNFMRNGGNLRVLQVLMGHSSLETTMMYTHVVDNDLEESYNRFHSV